MTLLSIHSIIYGLHHPVVGYVNLMAVNSFGWMKQMV